MLSTFALMFSKIYHVVEKTVANLFKVFIDLLRLERWSNFCGDAEAKLFFSKQCDVFWICITVASDAII